MQLFYSISIHGRKERKHTDQLIYIKLVAAVIMAACLGLLLEMDMNFGLEVRAGS